MKIFIGLISVIAFYQNASATSAREDCVQKAQMIPDYAQNAQVCINNYRAILTCYEHGQWFFVTKTCPYGTSCRRKNKKEHVLECKRGS